MKLVLENLGYDDAKPYEDAILRALQLNPVAGSFNGAAITLRYARGPLGGSTKHEVWPPSTKTNIDIASTVAAGILAASSDHEGKAFRTVEIEFT
jgi:hypothetical protein